jgi:Protein of unknown function (DUF4019)/NTF2-like N-terminal transpeptidase domain
MRRALYTPLSMVLFALAVASCGGKQQIANAETAVTQFHAQLNAGNFDQIYTDSDAAMKNASSQEKFVALLDAIHRKLGAAKSANRQSFFMNYGTSGKFLRLTYASQYDADNATEEFVFRVDGNNVRLAGYHINSEALVTK